MNMIIWFHPCENIPLGHIWTAKAQVGQHIHTVCSGPWKSANRIIWYQRLSWQAPRTWQDVWVDLGLYYLHMLQRRGTYIWAASCIKLPWHLQIAKNQTRYHSSIWDRYSDKYFFWFLQEYICCGYSLEDFSWFLLENIWCEYSLEDYQ